MRTLFRPTFLLACGGLVAASVTLKAAQISVTSRGALGGNDLVDWGAAGPDGTALGTPFSIGSVNGLSLTLSGSTGPNGFERADEGGSLVANFAPGAHLLWTGFSSDPQTITINFSDPVFGAGTQVAADMLDGFNATLSSYDSGGQLLRSDVFVGNTTQAEDDSAIFLGVLSDVQNISKLVLTVEPSAPLVGSFEINQLDLKRTIPDGGSLTALFALSALGMTALRNCRRSGSPV